MHTGNRLWTFDSGAPLLSSTNRLAPVPDVASAGAEAATVGNIFPGTDGSLYAYVASQGSRPLIERLPVGVSDLVNQSPVTALDGSMLIGSQHTSVFLLESRTGQLLRTIYDFDGELGQLDPASLGAEAGVHVNLAHVIVVGRKDYVLRSVHPQYGLQWNVTWGRVNRMTELEMGGMGGSTAEGALGSTGSMQAFPGMLLPQQAVNVGATAPPDISLLVGPDFSLRCVHPGDGWEQWQHLFDAPPVAAYAAGSGRIDLLAPEQQQRAAVQGSAGPVAPAYGALLPPTAGSTGSRASDAVVLVSQNGSVFGIPAAHLTFDAARDGAAAALVAAGAGEQCQEPEQQLEEPSGDEGKALALLPQPSPVPSVSGQGAAQCKPAEQDVCSASPLGVYPVQQTGSSSLLLLPPGANASAAAAQNERQQGGGQGSRRSWLVLLVGIGFGATASGAVLYVAMRQRQQAAVEAAAALQKQLAARPDGSAAVTLDGSAGGKVRRRRPIVSGRQGQQMSNRLKGLMQQAVLEVPSPTVAASAGVQQQSRQQSVQHQNGQLDDTQPSSAAVAAGLADPSMQRRQVKDGVILVGRMRVGPGVLGYGSGGTVVFAGELDGRPVAVKRMLRQFYEMARKEIDALILADEHPNIVRCFAMEEDHEFVYLALEKCKATLAEAMQSEAVRRKFMGPDGQPSAFAYRIASDIGRGVAALHERGLVHRDLKPQNVLLTEGGRAKLSDMGLSKRLVPEQISFESVGSGGSSGWQAPEQLISRSGGSARQTNSVDVFSFGLLLHYCLTGGQHPFGELYERDTNILQRRLNLKHVQHLPEAVNLIRGCCEPMDPDRRPPMHSIMTHPLWWPGPQRLAFLIAVSDRVEGEDRAEDRTMYQALECCAQDAIGPGGSWAAAMDSGLVNNLGKYRKYSYSSLGDLLRVIRNKHSHFRELPLELQKKVGPLPDGFLAYFAGRYPGLLMTCYYFALKWCAQEPVFQPYFPPEAARLLDTLAPPAVRQPQLPASSPEPALPGSRPTSAGGAEAEPALPQLQAADAALQAAREAAAAALAASIAMQGFAAAPDDDGQQQGQQQQQQQQQQSLQGEQQAEQQHLQTPQQQQHQQQQHVGSPPARSQGTVALFPQRPDQPVCDFFQKTGHCRFGSSCRFHHPPEFAVALNRHGLPIRRGQPFCSFFERTGQCKFGPSCKFDHGEN
ncbi:hypothetical protein ABPG75_000064 [Micractinium tetrahymenae]